jgi:hypothetical protein
MAAAVRQAFAAVTAITGLSITIAGSGPTYTVARAAGSWITDGVKLGNVGRLTAGAFNAANLSKNLFVTRHHGGQPHRDAAERRGAGRRGPDRRVDLHRHRQEDLRAELGPHRPQLLDRALLRRPRRSPRCSAAARSTSMAVQLPPTGMAGIDFDFLGKDVTTAGAQYFTTPTAETTTGILAAVNGLLASTARAWRSSPASASTSRAT